MQPILEELLEAGLDGWALWGWLTEPEPDLLDGMSPEQAVATDGYRERVLSAARDLAYDLTA